MQSWRYRVQQERYPEECRRRRMLPRGGNSGALLNEDNQSSHHGCMRGYLNFR